jgi:hypothetical protein
MSMLMHGLDRTFHSAQVKRARAAKQSNGQRSPLKRVSLHVLTIVAMGGLLAGLIAVKTAIFMPHIPY